MPSLLVIECAGDPRAMGRQQGAVCRDAIRAALEREHIASRGRSPASLRPFLAGPVLGAGMAREIVRHYPHLGERMQGLARGADLPAEAVMRAFVRAVQSESATSPRLAAAAAARGGADAMVLRSLCSPSPSDDWIVRRSRPEVGFASIELTLPWLVAGIAGVNEAGVAVAVAPRTPPRRSPGTSTPSALLLVQECLQRFEDVTGCIDWSTKRPVAGCASIVVADARGGVAAISFEGEECRIETPGDGSTVCGGEPAQCEPLMRALRAESLEAVVDALDAAVAAVSSTRSLRIGAGPYGPALTLKVC